MPKPQSQLLDNPELEVLFQQVRDYVRTSERTNAEKADDLELLRNELDDLLDGLDTDDEDEDEDQEEDDEEESDVFDRDQD